MNKNKFLLAAFALCILFNTACKKDKSLTITLTAQSARDMYVSVDIKPKGGTQMPADLNAHVLTYAKDFTVSEGDSVFCQLQYSNVYKATYSFKLNNQEIVPTNKITISDASTVEVYFSYRVPAK